MSPPGCGAGAPGSRLAPGRRQVLAAMAVSPLPCSAANRPILGETAMKAYVIAAETVKDDAKFAEYRKDVPATVEAFGGKFVARGGKLTTLEGEWPHQRVVVIEFPSRDAA